jgi:hypothetical protein
MMKNRIQPLIWSFSRILGVLLFMGVGNGVWAMGITANVQKAWNTQDVSLVYSAGYLIKSPKDFLYFEGGMVGLPASRSKTTLNEPGKYSKEYQNSAYGIYGGTYFYLMPVFRPGILVGTAIRDNIVLNSHDDNDYYLRSYSEFKLDYYIGFSVQAGIFSFVISNYGIGGGLCYMF